uniref:Sperm-activating peptide (Gly-3,5 SAP-I) n=1 Tax=Tripneustes gratilla TaxID=7673 RepID=Q7M3T9_TRIGR|nr:sperm-activating peptide I (3,5-Gly) [Tripneustes gratilla]
GFGLGGGGVG